MKEHVFISVTSKLFYKPNASAFLSKPGVWQAGEACLIVVEIKMNAAYDSRKGCNSPSNTYKEREWEVPLLVLLEGFMHHNEGPTKKNVLVVLASCPQVALLL